MCSGAVVYRPKTGILGSKSGIRNPRLPQIIPGTRVQNVPVQVPPQLASGVGAARGLGSDPAGTEARTGETGVESETAALGASPGVSMPEGA